ncbi:MAG TPA: prepilin-type N-terminal cleavage/methylation domain-containing protein [Rhizomicrobium sp.]|jgi:general secretion pathway protein J
MKDAGFTLMELLIAMTLLALLSLVLFGGFRFGTRAWDRSESASAGGNEIRRAQDFIAHALTGAYPELQNADLHNPHIFFDGRPQQVTFLTEDSQNGGLSVMLLARQGNNLVLSETPELARDPARQTRQRRLLTDVADFSLAYFGAARKNEPPRWYPAWRNTERLPELVRVHASLSRRGPSWTDLVVAPRIAGDVDCDYDPLTKFCKGR